MIRRAATTKASGQVERAAPTPASRGPATCSKSVPEADPAREVPTARNTARVPAAVGNRRELLLSGGISWPRKQISFFHRVWHLAGVFHRSDEQAMRLGCKARRGSAPDEYERRWGESLRKRARTCWINFCSG